MNAVVAVVGLWWAASGAAGANAAPPPRDVWDFYALLAKGGKLDDVLQQKGGAWKYKPTSESEAFEGVGTPVVDGRNGYMQYEYFLATDHEKVEVALFNAADGRHFIATNASERTERNEFNTFTFYEFTGAAFRDVTQEIGLPASLAVKDFMDEKFVPTPPAKGEVDHYVFKVEDAAMVAIHLPRQGTTMTAELVMTQNPPPIDGGPKLMEDAQKLFKAHRKYKAIDLVWSKADAKFTVAKAR
jgi:hypothetical protein